MWRYHPSVGFLFLNRRRPHSFLSELIFRSGSLTDVSQRSSVSIFLHAAEPPHCVHSLNHVHPFFLDFGQGWGIMT